jgi:putative ABC transport system permease protein
LYVPYAQNPEATTYVALRTADPGKLIPAVRARVAALDPELPIAPQSLDQTVHDSLIQISYMAAMLSFLGLMALALASVGVYGMMAFSVTEPTREIGIRLALGAETRTVVRMLLRRGAAIAAGGLAIGLLLSLALARLLASLIWGISALDVGTFAGVSALLLVVALVASWVPARRASRVDPLVSLRHE